MAMTIKNYGYSFQSADVTFNRSTTLVPVFTTKFNVTEKIINGNYYANILLNTSPGVANVVGYEFYTNSDKLQVTNNSGGIGINIKADINDMPTANVTVVFIIRFLIDDGGILMIHNYSGVYTFVFPRPMQFIFNFSLDNPNPNLLLDLNNDIKNEYDITDSTYIIHEQIVGFNVGDYKNVNISTIPNDVTDTAQNKIDYQDFGNSFNRPLKYPDFFEDVVNTEPLDFGTYNKITILFDLIGIDDFKTENLISGTFGSYSGVLDIALTEDYSHTIEGETYYTEQRPYFKAIINSTPEDYPFENIRNKVIFDDHKKTSRIFAIQDEDTGILQTKIDNIIKEDTASILFGSGVDWTYFNKTISSEILLGVNRYYVENPTIAFENILKKEFTERFVPKRVTAERVGTYTITLTFDTPGIENFNFYNLRFEDTAVGLSGERLDNEDLKNIGWG